MRPPGPEGTRLLVTVTRKLRVDAAVARRKVELLSEFEVLTPDVADVLAAIDLPSSAARVFVLGRAGGARREAIRMHVLLSEDLQDTRTIDGVQIVNPFREIGR